MNKQKPVAWMSDSDTSCVISDNEKIARYSNSDFNMPLFTADQLKAEREKAIRECLNIISKCLKDDIKNIKKVLSFLSTDNDFDEERIDIIGSNTNDGLHYEEGEK